MIRNRMLTSLYWATIVAFLLPLGLIALTSLSDSDIVGFPLAAPTLRWYGSALTDPAFRHAITLSVGLAVGSSVLAVASGTWIALAATALPCRWMRLVVTGLALIPLVTPGLIHAIALRIAAQTIGIDPGPAAVLLGHAIHATPYAVIMAAARRATLPSELIDAARDLGAGSASILIEVVLPWLRPALLGAATIALLTSFDDFIRSFFLGGYDATLPVLIFGRLHSGLTPQINAMATLVVVLACVIRLMADRCSASLQGRSMHGSDGAIPSG